MNRHIVKFTISPGGKVNMEVENGHGPSCVDVTQELEASISAAGKKTADGKKPEYFEEGPNVNVFTDLGR